jgi:hypothetical protein
MHQPVPQAVPMLVVIVVVVIVVVVLAGHDRDYPVADTAVPINDPRRQASGN